MNSSPHTENNPVVLWQISDGKRGHLSQSTGLVEALCRRAPLAVYRVQAPSALQALASCLTSKTDWANGLPAPQVAVGAGHATHAALLAVGCVHQAKTVVLMRPGLPPGWFDFCLAPAHDNTPARENVIVTIGALNPMQARQQQDPARGLILVGGPSRHYGLDSMTLLSAIRRVMAQGAPRHWTVSNSPRTPVQLSRALSQLETGEVEVALWERNEPGWLANALARARDVWITEDSMSMIYEALSAGCRVGLLPMPRKSASRLHKGTGQLLAQGFVSMYNERGAVAQLSDPPRTLAEADRCAALLLEKGLLTQNPGTATCP